MMSSSVAAGAADDDVNPVRDDLGPAAPAGDDEGGAAIPRRDHRSDVGPGSSPARVLTGALRDATAGVGDRAAILHRESATLSGGRMAELLIAMRDDITRAAGLIDDLVRAWLPLDSEAVTSLTVAKVGAESTGPQRYTWEREQAHLDRVAAAADRRRAAIDREAAVEERAVADHDFLTGVFGRRAGLTALQHEIDRCRRGNAPLVLGFVDVDGLKIVNDTCGHGAGDDVLRAVADALVSSLRSYDIVVRFGGDEFLFSLGEVDLAKSHAQSDRVRNAAARAGASVSVGLAELRAHDTLDSLIANADRALIGSRRSRLIADRPGRRPGPSPGPGRPD
jgi:diguanylate cyclase (GGDEF)-like protein